MKIYKVVTQVSNKKMVLNVTASKKVAVKLGLKYEAVNIETCEVSFIGFIVTAIFGKWFALAY